MSDQHSTPRARRPFLHGMLLGWSLGMACGAVPVLVVGLVVRSWWLVIIAAASIGVGLFIHREERRDPA